MDDKVRSKILGRVEEFPESSGSFLNHGGSMGVDLFTGAIYDGGPYFGAYGGCCLMGAILAGHPWIKGTLRVQGRGPVAARLLGVTPEQAVSLEDGYMNNESPTNADDEFYQLGAEIRRRYYEVQDAQ